jgi:hypothetical protein
VGLWKKTPFECPLPLRSTRLRNTTVNWASSSSPLDYRPLHRLPLQFFTSLPAYTSLLIHHNTTLWPGKDTANDSNTTYIWQLMKWNKYNCSDQSYKNIDKNNLIGKGFGSRFWSKSKNREDLDFEQDFDSFTADDLYAIGFCWKLKDWFHDTKQIKRNS